MESIVTGGLGFIGSSLCSRLLEKGTVTAVDNLHTGKKSNLSPGCRFIEGGSGQLEEKVPGNVDAIFHEGIFSSAPMYKADNALEKQAVREFRNLMEFACKRDAKVVIASTSSLYKGIPGKQQETMEVKPFDEYTKARRKMEIIADDYSKEYGMGNLVLRYFSVYGPGEAHKKRYANLVSQFIWAAEEGREIEIYGDGSQDRDFVYIDDVVEANMLALDCSRPGTYNIGTGKSHSLKEVVNIIEKISGNEVKTKNVPNPITEYVEHTLADTAKAEDELNFRAKTDIETGIRKTIDSVRACKK